MVDFGVVLRGYDRARVDELFRLADSALASDSPTTKADARALIEATTIRVVMRGYDREQVDDYLGHALATL